MDSTSPQSRRSVGRIIVLCAGVILSLPTILGVGWTRAQSPDTPPPSTSPAAQAHGVLGGQVTAASQASLSEMIVYLEPTDSKHRFSTPDQPAVISQKGARFSPSLLPVSVGQAVEFRNDEDRPIEHNVFSRSPAKPFDLGLYRPGVTRTVTFDKPGVVRLYCSIHRYMDGVIYVCPTPYFARVGSDGRYSISGVPPGEYDVKTWQLRQRYVERTTRVNVSQDKPALVNFELSRK